MKIIVTGSLGYIGKPLTKELIKKGHSVIVISSSSARKQAIEALGAKAAIGTMEDKAFLHMSKGNGLLIVHHNAENRLRQLPADGFAKRAIYCRKTDYITQLSKQFIESVNRS